MKFEENYSYGGWNNCIRLTNENIELIVTTDIGPRIIRFGFIGGQNIFREFANDMGKKGGSEYRLYGGTRFWHGPEAIPRTYCPDNFQVKYEWDRKTLTLLQDIEKTTGMQKEIKITLNPAENQVNLIYKMHNKNLWDIEFAPWVLSVMGLSGRGIVPHEPFKTHEEQLAPARPLVLWAYTTMDDPRWIWGKKYIQLKQDPEAKTKQKLGMLNTPGWAAYYLKGNLFCKRYKYDPEATYTDFGVNTEIYTDSDIFEVETLGAFKKIPPEGYSEHFENWSLFKVEIDESEESIDSKVLPLLK
jgi:hypothetical protein